MLLDIQSKVSILQKQLEQAKGQQGNNGVSQAAVDDIIKWQEKLAKADGKIAQLGIQLKAAKLNQQENEKDQVHAEQLKKMQAESDAKLKALNDEANALRQQIKQVAKILNIDVKVSDVVSIDVPLESQMSEKTNYVSWILLGIGIMLGFLGGFAYMQRKVSQRFGSAFRL